MFLADDVVIGCVKNFTSGESIGHSITHQCRNTLKIWAGLFQGSSSQILSRFTWEIIQTISGFIIAHLVNLVQPVNRVGYFQGCTILEGGGVGGSLCLGTFILLYPGWVIGDEVTIHEYGHALQSRASGPLYFLKYGISSLIDNRRSWVEADANARAAKFFGKDTFAHSHKRRNLALRTTDPKWWEYVLFFLGIGIIIIPFLNYREGK